jgi:pyroglutamyl-peptidase
VSLVSTHSDLPVVLLLGFEPFDGDAVNPSQDVVRALDGRVIAGHHVVTAVLPVVFASTLGALARLIDRTSPSLVLALGLAATRARLSLERVAINLIDARIPDNDGSQPVDVPVIAGAPAAYFTTLPVKAMARRMLQGGVPTELSLSAGTYVCNAGFFALRHLVAGRTPPVRAGFMHLPPLPDAGMSGVELGTQCLGVEIALRTALETDIDEAVPAGTIC